MSEARRRWIGIGIAMALIGVATIGVVSSRAQDATPVAQEQVSVSAEHSALIHTGNCETLDPNPLALLASVIFAGSEEDDGATPVAEGSPEAGTAMGSTTAIESGHSTTNVPLSLADILAAEHAIIVHLSPEQADVYVTCGAIGGEPDANGDLFIGLREQNGSGIAGIAWLHDNGDGASTTVTIMIASLLSEDASGEEATPAA